MVIKFVAIPLNSEGYEVSCANVSRVLVMGIIIMYGIHPITVTSYLAVA